MLLLPPPWNKPGTLALPPPMLKWNCLFKWLLLSEKLLYPPWLWWWWWFPPPLLPPITLLGLMNPSTLCDGCLKNSFWPMRLVPKPPPMPRLEPYSALLSMSNGGFTCSLKLYNGGGCANVRLFDCVLYSCAWWLWWCWFCIRFKLVALSFARFIPVKRDIWKDELAIVPIKIMN